jgi:hypothetical protein
MIPMNNRKEDNWGSAADRGQSASKMKAARQHDAGKSGFQSNPQFQGR